MFRIPLNLGKYVLLPMLATGFAGEYFNDDIDDFYHEMAQKYNFGFKEYNYAMDLIERADKFGKLHELKM